VLYASTGVGTAPHLAAELFAQRSGVKLVHVPYQGSPQAVTDLLAGRTTMMFSPASAVLGNVEAGKLKALASAANKRPAVAPNIPTMAEAGMPDFDTSIWFGLMAPNGTPRDITAKLEKALKEAQASTEVQSALKASGFDTISGGPEAFAKMMQSENKRWNDVAIAAGLKK
jgi:tripartite-type tricarboxylate transporter receptor subunit TctC